MRARLLLCSTLFACGPHLEPLPPGAPADDTAQASTPSQSEELAPDPAPIAEPTPEGEPQPLPDPEPTTDPTADPTPTGHPVVVVVGLGARRVRVDEHGTFSSMVQLDANGGHDNNTLRGVGFGDGLFVAIGEKSFTSEDGITWENENDALPNWMGGVGYVNGVFVAAGGAGNRVVSIDRAKSWMTVENAGSVEYRALVANGHIAVAAGATAPSPSGIYAGCGNYAAILSWTEDGTHWTNATLGQSGKACSSTAFTVSAIAHGSGLFVGAAYGGHIFTSSDGKTWSETSVTGTGDPTAAFANGTFWVSFAGGQSYQSANGSDWNSAGSAVPVVGFAGGYVGLVRESNKLFYAQSPTAWGAAAFQPGGTSVFLHATTGFVP